MIGDICKEAQVEALAAGSTLCKRITRATIDLREIVPQPGETPQNCEHLKYTNGIYYVRFYPSPKPKNKNKNYILVADILPSEKIRFGNIMALKEIAKKNEALRFILKNTTLTNKTLGIAKDSPGLPIMLGFDMTAYSEKITKKGNVKNYTSVYMDYDTAMIERTKHITYLQMHGKYDEKIAEEILGKKKRKKK